MKINKKLHSVAIASIALVLFFTLISSTASASITETKISHSGVAGFSAIYNNMIVWEDWHNGGNFLYLSDLSTKKETLITNSSQYRPVIYKSRIVWEDWRNNSWDIYMYDISTKKESKITSYGYAGQPDIYGNKIVWSNGDIYVYDISTSKKTQIADGRAFYPSIYGNIVVWWDNRNENSKWDIYAYDLSTHKETRITDSGSAESPDVYGNKIVWQDSRNGNWDIYMYDLSTKKETQITTNKSDQVSPAIYGNTIVWTDSRNVNWDIYAYDLKTHQQIHTNDKSDQTYPAIYGNKVVWTDYRNGKTDIYMGTISFLPVAAFSASPTTGKHSLNIKFVDKSTDAYYWSWNFGDKSTSTAQNPTHKYTKAGKYTVKLTVKNAAGSNYKTMTITVK